MRERDLASDMQMYIKLIYICILHWVVEALSAKTGGLTRKEIVESTKLKNNGDLTKILDNHILSGFIRATSFYKKKKKDTMFQLCDYYTAFYYLRD